MYERSYGENWYASSCGDSWGEPSWRDKRFEAELGRLERVFLARAIVDYTGQPSSGCLVGVFITTAFSGTGGIARRAEHYDGFIFGESQHGGEN